MWCYCVCVCLEYWWTWGAILYPYADIAACLEPTRNYTQNSISYGVVVVVVVRIIYIGYLFLLWYDPIEAMRNIYTHIHRGEGQRIKQLGCWFLLQQAIYLYKSYRLCFNIYFSSIIFVLFLFVSLWCSTHHGPVLIKTRPCTSTYAPYIESGPRATVHQYIIIAANHYLHVEKLLLVYALTRPSLCCCRPNTQESCVIDVLLAVRIIWLHSV